MRHEINRKHCLSDNSYKSFYNKQSMNSDLIKMRKGSRMKPVNWAVKELINNIPPPCKVLDVGCQHGIMELVLSALWYDVVAIDVAKKYVAGSKNNTSVLNQYIRYEVLPVEQVIKLNDVFQAVICLSVLEHVKDFDKALDSMLSVSDSGALMLFMVPIEKSWLTEEHTRVFTDENIYDYFPKESDISKIKFSDNPNKLGWYAVKYIKSS